jgi:hypothetical protein
MATNDTLWTSDQAHLAIKTYINTEEGQRYCSLFAQCLVASEDRQVFCQDANRRLNVGDDDAGRWWKSLHHLVENEVHIYLALAEPLAQYGVTIEEVFNSLPEEFGASALVEAFNTFAGMAPDDLPPGISQTMGWTDKQILARLEEVKSKLDWENTTGSARKWWDAFENENKQRWNLVLRLAEELANRKATITEFFLAYVYSNTDNIQANLSYLDYTRLKKEEERKRRESAARTAAEPTARETASLDEQSQDRTENAGSKMDEGIAKQADAYSGTEQLSWWLRPSPRTTRVRGWTDEQILARLEEVKSKLDWENTTGSARKWWDAFENENKHRWNLVLRLAEELAKRKATITEFFLAWVYSNTDNIQANLSYLDYTRLKKEEERKRRESAAAHIKQRAEELLNQILPLLEADGAIPELSSEDISVLRQVPEASVPERVRARLADELSAAETRMTEQRLRDQADRIIRKILDDPDLSATELGSGEIELAEKYIPQDLNDTERELLRIWIANAQRVLAEDDQVRAAAVPGETDTVRAQSSSVSSTGLTFVRCPACRSLVPAVSSRCRMCGSQLKSDNSNVDDDIEAEDNS